MRFSTIFWDIGGVLLTNGWDTAAREKAAARFGLDLADYGQRHAMAVTELETGRITLDQYLEQTVFCSARTFSAAEFKEFMFAQSRPIDGTLEVLADVARSGRYTLATLNNESRELNEYRLRKFGLHQWFSLYVCSSFLGVMKPGQAIFKMALDLTQQDPAGVLMIDDRPLNVEAATRAGMHAIHFRDAAQLRKGLEGMGVSTA